MDNIQIILAGICIALLLAIAFLLMGGPSAGKESQRRLQSLRLRHSDSTSARVESQLRKAIASRKTRFHKVAGAGSRIEGLQVRLRQTGKSWTVAHYLYASLGLMVVVTLFMLLRTGALPLSLGVGLVVGAGLPHMVVGYLINKRINSFTSKFPDAIDLLVRGLRSGLPVGETLSVISTEIPGPVGDEFRGVVERIKIGRTMEDALQDTADRLGTPEFQFFVITLAIQRETGGNLAETLSNLSDVLRKRAQMKLKIKAMSSESKASAYIVGSLPFIVFGLVWTVNPTYIENFFIDDRLIIAGIGGLVWMSIGGFIMAKMVNFEI
ncbi:pilus assembly protein TadB [Altererythrobacter xixiisoli]|uniref:Pilus assembly protein TadB n=1 Tax=Croceibacterium xixiisoli TaxID=1476466 RepID=A0A6I4TQJ7_9SPHN|nr:type II secretion system F family protein [Croceibacterium xixiisoli]MXO98144.1 pilus assembly protein TadB [Croceibacterium xixiisoli]